MKKHLWTIVLIVIISSLAIMACKPAIDPGGGDDASDTIEVTGISLDITSESLLVSATRQLTATITPADATNTDVTWSSSADGVATVSGTGFVTAVANGMATITVNTNDGGQTATCAVTVTTPGTASLVIQPTPTQAKLISKVGATTRLSMGLGMSLPYNTWVPWEVAANETLWFPIVAEAGKTYSVQWDDSYNGSGNYSGDIEAGVFLVVNGSEVSGWNGTYDTQYSSGKTFTVTTTQLVYVKVIPYHTDPVAEAGSFAVMVSEGSSTNPDQSFAWYEDGALISGATDYTYTVDPAVFTAGKHRITAIANRGGALFSETYTFTK